MFDSSWFQPFDYSSVVADSSMFSAMFSSLKFSLRSAGSIGLIVLGVTLSIALISTVLNRLFLDKQKIIKATEKREFSRKVYSADVYRNLDSIVSDGVKHREISFLVNSRFQFLHKGMELDESLHRRELSRNAFSMDFLRNLDDMIDDGVKHRELNFLVGQKYRELHSDWDIENSVHRREISKESAKQYYRGRRSK